MSSIEWEASYHALGVGRVDGVGKRDLLAIRGSHADDILVSELVRPEDEVVDPLETLLNVRLDPQWIFRLGQNLQQFVVGKEEEAGEEQPFLFQVIIQSCFKWVI